MTVTIYTGDCRELLNVFDDESFDCIVTDPPYGETSLEWDKWQTGWLSAARRVLKRTGSMWVFGSQRMFLNHADELNGWKLAQDIIWEKHNGSGFHADRFKRVHEHALQFYRDDAKWGDVFKAPQFTNDARERSVRRKKRPTHMGNIDAGAYVSVDGGPRLMRSVIFCRSEHRRADHPTQKPIGIVEPLLLYACPRGGSVLDCFSGSGTTGLVASRHGISATLIEADSKYVDVTNRRLQADGLLAATEEAA